MALMLGGASTLTHFVLPNQEILIESVLILWFQDISHILSYSPHNTAADRASTTETTLLNLAHFILQPSPAPRPENES
jgi:hypothetical protein